MNITIIGATGYVGEELIHLLSFHPKIKIVSLFARTSKSSIDEIYPNFKGIINLQVNEFGIEKIKNCDLAFLAVPHTVSMQIVPNLIKKLKIIDLSSDYRFKNPDVYEKWYNTSHIDKNLLKYAVYGLPEIFKEEIKKADLVAVSGCYPTSIILAVAPLLKETIISSKIIIDSKSGVSGAGRNLQLKNLFCECNENLKAYNIGTHRHQPEISEILSQLAEKNIEVIFTPHLVPMNRGILSTIYCTLKKKFSTIEIISLYEKFYTNSPFIKIVNSAEIKNVRYSNYCHISLKVIEKSLIIVSCIDNLIKGAAGQAIQCMNIMFGFDEITGLKTTGRI